MYHYDNLRLLVTHFDSCKVKKKLEEAGAHFSTEQDWAIRRKELWCKEATQELNKLLASSRDEHDLNREGSSSYSDRNLDSSDNNQIPNRSFLTNDNNVDAVERRTYTGLFIICALASG